jgi:hypothetical protein
MTRVALACVAVACAAGAAAHEVARQGDTEGAQDESIAAHLDAGSLARMGVDPQNVALYDNLMQRKRRLERTYKGITTKMNIEKRQLLSVLKKVLVMAENFHDIDEENIKRVRKRKEADVAAVKLKINAFVDLLRRANGPVKQMITEDWIRGKKMLAGLEGQAENMRKAIQLQLEFRTRKHEERIQTLRRMVDVLYTKLLPQLRRSVVKVPNLYFQRSAQVDAAIEQNKADVATAVNRWVEQQRGAISQTQSFIDRLISDADSTFRMTADQALKLQDKTLGIMSSDIATTQEDSTELLNGLMRSLSTGLRSLQTDASRTEMTARDSHDRFVNEQEIEAKFPAVYKSELEEVMTRAADALGEVKKTREDRLGAVSELFKKISEKETRMVIKQIQRDRQTAIMSAHRTVSDKLGLMMRNFSTTADMAYKLNNEAQAYNDDVRIAEESQKGAEARLSQLKAAVKRTGVDLEKQWSTGQKPVQEAALKVAKESERMLDGYLKEIREADATEEERFKEAVVQTRAAFEKNATGEAQRVNGALGDNWNELKKFHKLMRDLQGVMGEKIGELQGVVARAKDEDAVKLHEMSREIMDGALDKVSTFPDVARSAYLAAEAGVRDHLGGLDKVATEALQGLKTNIRLAGTKLTDNVEKTRGPLIEAAEAIKTKGDLAIQQAKATLAASDTQYQALAGSRSSDVSELNTDLLRAKELVDGERHAVQLRVADEAEQVKAFKEQGMKDLMTAQGNVAAELEQAGAETAMETAVQDTTKTVQTQDATMKATVSDAVTKLKDNLSPLGKAQRSLKSMFRQWKLKQDSLQKGAELRSAELKQAMADEEAAGRLSDTEMGDLVSQEASKAAVDMKSLFKRVDADTAAAADKVTPAVADDVDSARSAIDSANNDANEAADLALRTGNEELSSARDGVENTRKSVEAAAVAAEAAVAKTEAELDKTKAGHASNVKKFEEAMQDVGERLGSILGEDKPRMTKIMETLHGVSSEVKTGLTAQAAADEDSVRRLMQEVESAANEVHEDALGTERTVTAVEDKLAKKADEAENALTQSEDRANDYEVKLSALSHQFVGKLEGLRRQRLQGTETLLSEGEETGSKLSRMEQRLQTLGGKATAYLKYAAGSLDLERDRLDKHVTEMANLTQYAEKDALSKISAKQGQVLQGIEEADTWKAKTVESSRKFQNMAVQEFRRLGTELDLSSLEEAEARALQQWAVREQTAQLAALLGDEFHDLDASAKKRLAALAARSGKEIAKLMKNGDPAAAARALEKIQDAAKSEAHKILMDQKKMELEAATAARNLQMGVSEVESTMKHISQLEGASAPPAGLETVVERVKRLIMEVEKHVDAGTGMAPPNATDAGSALLEEGAGDAAQRASEQTEADLARSAALDDQLTALSARLAIA